MVKDKNIELAKVYNGCPRCWKLFLNVTKVRHLFRNCQIKQKGIEAAVKCSTNNSAKKFLVVRLE